MARGKRRDNAKRRRITFKLNASRAKSVSLTGDFNGWDTRKHPMKRVEKGRWEKSVLLPPGRYEYKFLVDGEWWNDPQNRDLCSNCFGTENNVVTVR